jgi:hypothetical protein
VELSPTWICCCKENGKLIWYLYPTASVSPCTSSEKCSYTVLMEAARPEKYFISQERLYDDIVNFLIARQLEFAPECENTV